MIKKLKTKVFLILMISISTVVIGTITIFAIINYNNTFNIAYSTIERFSQLPQKYERDFENLPNNGLYKNEILDEAKNTEDSSNNEIVQNNQLKEESPQIDIVRQDIHKQNINIENLKKEDFDFESSNIYYFLVENEDEITALNDGDSETQKYALEVSKKDRKSGTIGNYIYKTRITKEGTVLVYLMEDSNAINRLRSIYILAIVASIILLIIIYIISKKVTNIIVLPVEETINKQKQFISDASHELKTPLAVIEANVDVLESQIGENKWMQYIQSEITSMEKLINDLLFLAKIENTKNMQINEIFNLSEEVNLISSMFESMAYEKNISINYNIPDNIKINANKEEIKQVLSILIDNAIKHTKENRKVTIELNNEKNNVLMQVKNEGEPIPEEEKDKIFERFYRVDKSRNRKEKRYGLGLAIAKSIIESYKGKIEVYCKDGITVFKVILPK